MNEHAVFADSTADLAQRVQRVGMFIVVIVAGEAGEVRYDFLSKTGSAGWEVLSWSDEEIQSVVEGALALLSAERIEPGEYRIITAARREWNDLSWSLGMAWRRTCSSRNVPAPRISSTGLSAHLWSTCG